MAAADPARASSSVCKGSGCPAAIAAVDRDVERVRTRRCRTAGQAGASFEEFVPFPQAGDCSSGRARSWWVRRAGRTESWTGSQSHAKDYHSLIWAQIWSFVDPRGDGPLEASATSRSVTEKKSPDMETFWFPGECLDLHRFSRIHSKNGLLALLTTPVIHGGVFAPLTRLGVDAWQLDTSPLHADSAR